MKKRSVTQSIMKTSEFYEERLLLEAQELISRLMDEQNVTKTDLAKKLNKSKAHVTGLLSDGRNLTLKTLANVCYHLSSEVGLQVKSLNGYEETRPAQNNSYDQKKAVDVSTALTRTNGYQGYAIPTTFH